MTECIIVLGLLVLSVLATLYCQSMEGRDVPLVPLMLAGFVKSVSFWGAIFLAGRWTA